ncbi:MAG: M28 family peptidase [Vulcanimicrobiota bacterium]
MKRFSLCLVFLLSAAALARPVTVEELEAHIRFLAHPLTEGRGLGSEGLEIASLYIESQFREAGLQPVFDGSYRQEFELLGSTPDPEAALQLPGNSELSYGEDFLVFTSHRDLPEELRGELVYCGYLISAPEREWDDIKGADLKDKILLVEVNEPGNEEGGLFEGPVMTYYGRWTYKYEQAARLGARGVLLIHNDKRATYGWSVVRNSWTSEGFTIPEEFLGSPFQGWISEEVAGQVFAEAGLDHDQLLARAETPGFKPVALNQTAALRFSPTFRTVKTSNIGALLAAENPAEAPTVVLTAHHDHIGTADGKVYSGVVDNSSASSVLLALARYFSEQEKLPINLLFVSVSAEEQGLWGSRYLIANPPVPRQKIWANINLEMTNIWGPTEDVYAIGAANSDLDQVAREAADKIGVRYIEELDKENGFFFRSDQFSFARAGIPGLWPHEGPSSDSGVAEKRKNYRATHYHQTSDSLAEQSKEWNLEGTLQITDWVVAMIEVLASRSEAPEWVEGSAFSR